MINFIRSPHPPCCFLLQHTLVSPPQSSSPLPQTLSQQLHPPQRHQRLQTTPQYYWTSQLPLPHFLGHQIPLHLLWHEEIPLYHHTSLPRQTPSPSTQHICFHNPIPYILLSWQLLLWIQRPILLTRHWSNNGISTCGRIGWDKSSRCREHCPHHLQDPPNTYRHFVDDGIGDFRDKSHEDGFLSYLNSLTDDLQYTNTIEYPSHDGSLPYMDILIHADKSTSVYRKPTHTNLYVRYNSCAPSSSKDSVIRSLTRRAPILCSPQHLQKELDTVYTTSLPNGHPLTESNASWRVSNKN